MLLPKGAKRLVPGSSWGAFTIACTVPIALAVGWYMYRFRKGKVVEASILGAIAVLGVTVLGASIPGSRLEPYFSWSKETTTYAIAGYGFVASILPVWLLLCPRDYLSSFLKIGTIALLVVGVCRGQPDAAGADGQPPVRLGGRAVFRRADLPVRLHLHHVRRRVGVPCAGLLGDDARRWSTARATSG